MKAFAQRLYEKARGRRFAEDAPTKSAEGKRFCATKGETAPMAPRAGQAPAPTGERKDRASSSGENPPFAEKALRMGHAPRNFFEAWLRYNAGIWRIARMRAFGLRIFPKKR
jgi:hypothetical protein